jgi:hypothetical protein
MKYLNQRGGVIVLVLVIVGVVAIVSWVVHHH